MNCLNCGINITDTLEEGVNESDFYSCSECGLDFNVRKKKMKIDIKTQTARATSYRKGFNCVNLFLGDFEVGLTTRAWGEKEEGEHRITFRLEGHDYEIPLYEFKTKLRRMLKEK